MTDGTEKVANHSTHEGSDANPPKHFEAIVAEGEDGIVVLEPNGVIVYANPAAEFLLGRGRTELVGDMFGLPAVPIDEAITVNVVSRDDVVRLIELRIEPLTGSPQGTLVLRLKDVTNYQRSVLEAREEVRQRDEFLAMLSHEIRNPLAAIRSAALLLACDDLDAHLRLDISDVLDRQFMHLTRILDDLLDVTRIMRSKLTINPVRVDLNRILKDAIEAIAPLARERHHEVKMNLAEQTLWVNGDATRLEQIVVNLLNNAVKFTPNGGQIILSTRVDGANVEICVRDNGPGIIEELLPRIFDPFVQGRQTLDRSDGGLGIGLMLVRTFVTLHNGTINVQPNVDGRGTTFTVGLPLSEGEGAPTQESVEQRSNRHMRILVVEDSDTVRRMLTVLLRKRGHEVVEAATGPDGLRAALKNRLDIALIDIGLPGMDGYELIRRFRCEKKGSLPRLVALTGYGTPEDIQKARQAGFDEHMVKPVDVTKLWHLIETCTKIEWLPQDGESRQPLGGTGRAAEQ